jgi:Domain of unknown function (DUF5664)
MSLKVGDKVRRKVEFNNNAWAQDLKQWATANNCDPFGVFTVKQVCGASIFFEETFTCAWLTTRFELVEEATAAVEDNHKPGAKADAGKYRPALVLGGFARALIEVSKVGTFGAVKYTDNGWTEVPNGQARYDDAQLRHWLDDKRGVLRDNESELLHKAHDAWNALAKLDLYLREQEKTNASE